MTDANSAIRAPQRRCLALWFPFLPAERLRRAAARPGSTPEEAAAEGLPDAPLVLVARSGNAMRISAVDAAATAAGLVPGQALADARAMFPDLVAVAHDGAADGRWLDRMARECRQWTPLVEPLPPDVLALDVTGCAHLFGGERALVEAVRSRFAELGMTCRAGLSGNAAAARALARHGGGDARALPVAALELDGKAATAMRRAGLRTIGDLAARPMAAIAARFGEDAVLRLRALLGETPAPLNPLLTEAPLHFERRFAEPVVRQATIAAELLDLMRAAAAALAGRGLGGRRFRLVLLRSDGARRTLEIATGAPTRDPALVLRLFDERIETLADPLDPGFGYDSIALAVPLTEPLGAVQPPLAGVEDTAAQGEEASLAELIDRLSTRLGPDAVRRLVPQDSHIPEQAQLALPAIACRKPVPWPVRCAPDAEALPENPPMRPLYLFDPPQPVEVLAQVPDGPPHRFRWKRKLHEVRLYEGPERIAAEWWRREQGEMPGLGGLTRDYYRVEDVRGRRFWIFRHGLYDEKPDPKWYLHGLFA